MSGDIITDQENQETVEIPDRFQFENPGKDNWFEDKFQFIPPPGFVNVNGPTYQKMLGVVRGVPAKFSRDIKILGCYNMGYLAYILQRAASKIPETERILNVGIVPDGYGGTCLLVQCMETEDKSIWVCLKPEGSKIE